jgi:hypothetical protein
MHESKTDAVEYLPAPHSAHELAPVLAPVLVIEPAVHSVHADISVDSKALTYRPFGQSMHDTASGREKEPDMHDLQKVCFVS